MSGSSWAGAFLYDDPKRHAAVQRVLTQADRPERVRNAFGQAGERAQARSDFRPACDDWQQGGGDEALRRCERLLHTHFDSARAKLLEALCDRMEGVPDHAAASLLLALVDVAQGKRLVVRALGLGWIPAAVVASSGGHAVLLAAEARSAETADPEVAPWARRFLEAPRPTASH